MANLEKEGCPVCWREYSQQTLPTSVSCGHTFCADCLGNLRNCPLCRKRIAPGAVRSTNYSLLSLVNRVNAVQPVEKKDQEVQTAPIGRRRAASSARNTDVVAVPGQQQPIRFKFSRNSLGGLRSLEVLLN